MINERGNEYYKIFFLLFCLVWCLSWIRDGFGGYFVILILVSCVIFWNIGKKNFKRLYGSCFLCELLYWMEVMLFENDRYF